MTLAPKFLWEYYGGEGEYLRLDRAFEGFRITLLDGRGARMSMILPFAKGDEMAIAFRPGFDPARDNPDAIIHAEEPPHPDD